MARPRSGESSGLPDRMGMDARYGTFRYYRPDTRKQIWLGSDRSAAVAAGEALSRFFEAASRGESFDWSTVSESAISVLRDRDFDYLPRHLATHPLQRLVRQQKRAIKSAAAPALDTQLQADALPKWAANLFRQTKKNADARGIEFALEKLDLVEMVAASNGKCSVTGMALEIASLERKGMRRPWMPSIDRINSDRGYTPDNCRIVCVAANLAMGQWGEAVLIEMARAIAAKMTA